jgi:hypothetical protein
MALFAQAAGQQQAIPQALPQQLAGLLGPYQLYGAPAAAGQQQQLAGFAPAALPVGFFLPYPGYGSAAEAAAWHAVREVRAEVRALVAADAPVDVLAAANNRLMLARQYAHSL